MRCDRDPARFAGLPRRVVLGRSVPVARGSRARLLGLSLLHRGQAGPGLLIPCCRSVHTFGMRFPLDLYFLDRAGRVVAARRAVAPGRFAGSRSAAAVLELPAEGGDSGPPGA